MKTFLITVDTEGDNLWQWKPGEKITTENSLYIPRFQELCEKYGLIPTYLTNYEMAQDDHWLRYVKPKAQQGLCEIGMHIHAWNSPPEYQLNMLYSGNPYITEYPDEIIDQKVKFLKEFLENRFETQILSNRSGRWATDDRYFKVLAKYGILADCSIAPQMNLSKIPGRSKCCGNNYVQYSCKPYRINEQLIEIPMTSRIVHKTSIGSLKHRAKVLFFGEGQWLRPIYKSLQELIALTEQVEREQSDYLEFMIHSSEFMLGGSPYYKNTEEIEMLFQVMDKYFEYVTKKSYVGLSLTEYGRKINEYI